ncbi:MAG: flagellar basal body-associated FliL family protein [Lachnospiraceae bacterium]|nr:flagellar basal body-associated FliL family protein [Lachnospiraceae bacterium]
MKKSLLNIISLALGIVNLALLLVLIFAIVPTMNKANRLVGQICTAIDLELENSYGTSSENNINIDNLVTYDLEQSMTIPLAPSGDQKDHYAVASITLVMDSTHEDYKNYGEAEKLAERVSLIKSTIRKVFANYTVEQAKDLQYQEVIRQAILEALHALYQSDFIYEVRFTELLTS